MVPCFRRRRKSCLLFLLTCTTLLYVLQFLFDHYRYPFDLDDLVVSPQVFPQQTLGPISSSMSPLHEPLSFNPRVRNIPWNYATFYNLGQNNYFKPRKSLVNPIHVNFLLDGKNICEKRRPYLLVMVPTLPSNQKSREVIRETWASTAKTQRWPLRIVNAEVKIFFMLGMNKSSDEFEKVTEENDKHQDLVMADFVDSYRNLSLKILTGLTWMKLYCSEARFILKCDEDTFVNIPLIVDFLLMFENQFNFTAIGYIYGKSRVLRTGRWKVEWSDYPISHYPTYTSGNAYILPRALALRVLDVSEYMPYVPVEDAYITGILTRVAGGRHINSKYFTYLGDKKPNSCAFLKDDRLAWTRASSSEKYAIWKAFKTNKC